MKGYKHSEPRSPEHCEKIRLSKIGYRNPMWGKKQSKESVEKRAAKLRGRVMSLEERNAHSLAVRGSKGPRWKGGVSHRNKLIRRGLEFREWRKKIFCKDNWTCHKCYVKGGCLHPHHIKNFAEFPELRFVVTNGVTLCKKCHMAFHKRFGLSQNNDDQLADYLLYKFQMYAI